MSHHDGTTNWTLTPQGPANRLSELPGLLGYCPSDSLVVLFSQDQTLRCVLRMDLSDLGHEAAIGVVTVAHQAEAGTFHDVLYASTTSGPATVGRDRPPGGVVGVPSSRGSRQLRSP